MRPEIVAVRVAERVGRRENQNEHEYDDQHESDHRYEPGARGVCWQPTAQVHYFVLHRSVRRVKGPHLNK